MPDPGLSLTTLGKITLSRLTGMPRVEPEFAQKLSWCARRASRTHYRSRWLLGWGEREEGLAHLDLNLVPVYTLARPNALELCIWISQDGEARPRKDTRSVLFIHIPARY